MNRSQTVSKGVVRLAQYTGREQAEVDAIARELINAGELPKSQGRDFAQMNVQNFGLLTLAVLCVDRPTRTVPTLAKFKELRLFQARGAKSSVVKKAQDAIEGRGLLLSASPLRNITALPALFQVDYFQRPEDDFTKRVDKATIIIDRAHGSAIVDWGDALKSGKGFEKMATASVFGELEPSTYGRMPVEVRWELKFFIQAQLSFFQMPSGWVGEEKQA